LREQASHGSFSAMRDSMVLTLALISVVGTIWSEM
jgi:hypothetical protein